MHILGNLLGMVKKKRVFPEHNYYSVWMGDGRTFRFQIDDDKPITELSFPEFYDVKITGYCTGNCPWCYMDSRPEFQHYEDIVGKAKDFFGNMSENERPFQVAIGGGNPNEHPDFIEFCEYLLSIGIVPNYTTNGIGITPEIIKTTLNTCGGVALSAHPHLEKYWKQSTVDLYNAGVDEINSHIIISDRESIDYFLSVYNDFKKIVKHFVLLPYITQGRAPKKDIDFDYLSIALDNFEDLSKIAFGAHFYEYLLDKDWPVSLYEPETMSGFLDMYDMRVYNSSFDLTEKRVGYETA